MTLTVTSSRKLTRPVPDDCSDRYASGWAYADWHISKGGDLNADAPADWHEEMVNGFWDRLTAERNANSNSEKGQNNGHQ